MALDGIFLHFLAREIEETCLGARLEKISQPSRDELVFQLRGREGTRRLLLSGGAASPRVHLIENAPENPKTPPMFCMLLRKRLGGGRLTAVRQAGLDRILQMEFECTDELGDPVTLTVVVEIMGRHSNIIVVDEKGKIVDAIRRVDLSTSRVRQILPGMTYAPAPAQDKRSILEEEPARIVEEVRRGREAELSKALMERLEGFSQISCREAAFFAARGEEVLATELSDEAAERLAFFLTGVADRLRGGEPAPTMVLETGGRPRDFCCLPVYQYGAAMLTREYPSCSLLLEHFYSDRDRMERLRQRSGDLLNLLASTSDRIARKLSYQREELKECGERDALKQKGDLIGANLYRIAQGDTQVEVENFYGNGELVEIQLDARLSPTQNAQRYYALYRKADTAEKHLHKLIAQGESELAYVDSVFDALTRADGEAELDAIRRELAESGYLRRARTAAAKGKRPAKEPKLPYLRYRSSDGYLILAGRNNYQNDRLTLREAKGGDLWLHTQKIPGSHVIVQAGEGELPDRTIEEAAAVAAYNSKGRQSSKVPVDYTPVKHVKKPAGAKPGMVIYDRYWTVLAEPDPELVRKLEALAEG